MLKGIYGGHHFIYVNRLEYDECVQLAASLISGIPFKFKNLESGTWTMASVVNSGINLLSLEEGLIPNEVKVSLSVNNRFAKEDINQDLDRIKRCDVYDNAPVYQFEIVYNKIFAAIMNSIGIN